MCPLPSHRALQPTIWQKKTFLKKHLSGPLSRDLVWILCCNLYFGIFRWSAQIQCGPQTVRKRKRKRKLCKAVQYKWAADPRWACFFWREVSFVVRVGWKGLFLREIFFCGWFWGRVNTGMCAPSTASLSRHTQGPSAWAGLYRAMIRSECLRLRNTKQKYSNESDRWRFYARKHPFFEIWNPTSKILCRNIYERYYAMNSIVVL